VFLNIPCNFLVVPKIGGWDFEIFMVNQWIKKHVYLIYDSRISNQLQLFSDHPTDCNCRVFVRDLAVQWDNPYRELLSW